MRKPISIKEISKPLTKEELQLDTICRQERILLGIYDIYDSNDNNYIEKNFTQITKEFRSFNDYIKALRQAQYEIHINTKASEPNRSKLIKVKKQIEKYCKQNNLDYPTF